MWMSPKSTPMTKSINKNYLSFKSFISNFCWGCSKSLGGLGIWSYYVSLGKNGSGEFSL